MVYRNYQVFCEKTLMWWSTLEMLPVFQHTNHKYILEHSKSTLARSFLPSSPCFFDFKQNEIIKQQMSVFAGLPLDYQSSVIVSIHSLQKFSHKLVRGKTNLDVLARPPPLSECTKIFGSCQSTFVQFGLLVSPRVKVFHIF